MEAKEKAKELLLKMNAIHYVKLSGDRKLPVSMYDDQIKQCALIAVEELIQEQDMWQNGDVSPAKYWQEVKKELENELETTDLK